MTRRDLPPSPRQAWRCPRRLRCRRCRRQLRRRRRRRHGRRRCRQQQRLRKARARATTWPLGSSADGAAGAGTRSPKRVPAGAKTTALPWLASLRCQARLRCRRQTAPWVVISRRRPSRRPPCNLQPGRFQLGSSQAAHPCSGSPRPAWVADLPRRRQCPCTGDVGTRRRAARKRLAKRVGHASARAASFFEEPIRVFGCR
mmetsp:Transcript_10259/g.35921  ORF Transcript_10259/g.35921 Transcript_10259/m.35921 type:complete len:201 (-) Transcript_10259:69-671(-)